MAYYLKQNRINEVPIPQGLDIHMLNDSDRIDLVLKPAIRNLAKNKIVLDLGAGTGVLGRYSLEQGAKFVYFVERDQLMYEILKKVLKSKLQDDTYKVIRSEGENLTSNHFDRGLPELCVSELHGPKLFDEGYVPLSRHVKSIAKDCVFIPGIYEANFYIAEIDYSRKNLWPDDEFFADYYKVLYSQKGFYNRYKIDFDQSNLVGTIYYDANSQKFNNKIEFTHSSDRDYLLIADGLVKHKDLTQHWCTFGWVIEAREFEQAFRIFFDVNDYYDLKKIKLSSHS